MTSGPDTRIQRAAVGASIAFVHGLAATPALADSRIPEERVQFAKGA
jgi:hypothetical protein